MLVPASLVTCRVDRGLFALRLEDQALVDIWVLVA